MERPSEVDPFLRGLAWPAADDVAYPRADPADIRRLPSDTWAAAMLPVGVRLEISGSARHINLEYVTRNPAPSYGLAPRSTFSVWRNGEQIDEREASIGSGTVRLLLGEGSDRAIVYLPESLRPMVTRLDPIDGTIEPAPQEPRWLAYGDSIAEGWVASTTPASWVSIVGRTRGLDAINLGYAGAARGEVVSAEQLARVEADVISVTHGTNCWGMIPFSSDMMRSTTEAFLRIVRSGHPGVPIVVASPILRPDAEDRPNRLGATLGDIRNAMEEAVRAVGDELTTLVSGKDLLPAHLLADGIHPNDEGHQVLAGQLGAAVYQAAQRSTL
jgi:lysophospholipase L1-like esterase